MAQLPFATMRRALSSIAGFLLLACLIWQWGHLSTFDLRLARVKKEIKLRLKAGVPEGERVHFTFSREEVAALAWVKPDREFRWKDRYYDVVERTTDAEGKIHFACIDDRQETELFAELGAMVERTMDSRSEGRSSSAKIIALWKVFFHDAFHPAVPTSPSWMVFGSVGSAMVLCAHARLEDPPPRV